MKRISLTQNQFAIVDDKNYEWLNQWKWYALWNKNAKGFYAVRNRRYQISMSRTILGLERGDKRQSDHINHNTLDNREKNLRIVTHGQNQFNRKNPKGYTWNKAAKKYRAQIKLNIKNIHLGYFDKAKDARNAYLEAKKKYHKI